LGIYWIWTPYGGSADLEPPDDEWVCDKCWQQMDAHSKEILYSAMWRKPFRVEYRMVNDELVLIRENEPSTI
jgi:hypothetical protein